MCAIEDQKLHETLRKSMELRISKLTDDAESMSNNDERGRKQSDGNANEILMKGAKSW